MRAVGGSRVREKLAYLDVCLMALGRPLSHCVVSFKRMKHGALIILSGTVYLNFI